MLRPALVSPAQGLPALNAPGTGALPQCGDRDGAPGSLPSFEAIYEEHFDFVWLSAQRLGVAANSLDDVVQETFVIVHGKLGDFEGRSSLKSWIFGILANVVRHHRRTLRRRDDATPTLPSVDPDSLPDGRSRNPHDHTETRDELRVVVALLER